MLRPKTSSHTGKATHFERSKMTTTMSPADTAKQMLENADYQRGVRDGRAIKMQDVRQKGIREGQVQILQLVGDFIVKTLRSLSAEGPLESGTYFPNIPLDQIGLKPRTVDRLRKLKIHTTADLYQWTERRLRTNRFGLATIREIRACLKAKGLRDLDG